MLAWRGGPLRRTYWRRGPLRQNRIGAILRVNPSGSSVTTNPFYSTKNTGKKRARNDIFAYGIRNSFGLAFDPVSSSLWETENGPASFDEVNRITPGFNGGWESILGPTSRNGADPSTLVSLGDRAHYADPKFSWANPVAPTAAFFMPTARLGSNVVVAPHATVVTEARVGDSAIINTAAAASGMAGWQARSFLPSR